MKNCAGCGILLDAGDWWSLGSDGVCCTDCWYNNGFKNQYDNSSGEITEQSQQAENTYHAEDEQA